MPKTERSRFGQIEQRPSTVPGRRSKYRPRYVGPDGRRSPRAMEKIDLWFNKRWINNQMRTGSRIVDIGEPPGYPPSAFYNMERQQVNGYWNYVQDIGP